jgi:hypothetical protein
MRGSPPIGSERGWVGVDSLSPYLLFGGKTIFAPSPDNAPEDGTTFSLWSNDLGSLWASEEHANLGGV